MTGVLWAELFKLVYFYIYISISKSIYSPESQPFPGLHQRNVQVKGGDSVFPYHSHETPPGIPL